MATRLRFATLSRKILYVIGSNICPQEVEDALQEGAKRPTSQELIRFARARVGYKAPEEIAVLEAMPLNATGKVDRVTLKRMAEQRAGA